MNPENITMDSDKIIEAYLRTIDKLYDSQPDCG
jgi:hypothetical protein